MSPDGVGTAVDGGMGREQAILRPTQAARAINVGRAQTRPSLRAFVDYLWWVTWDVAESHEQEVIPAPVVHVAVELLGGEPRLVVTGVQRRRFVTPLTGRGFVVAAAFRAGGLRPFLAGRVADVTDRRLPAADLLGADDRATAAAILDRPGPDDEARRLLNDWLEALDPQPDPVVEEVAGLVERAEHDASLTRAEHLAALAGVSLRTLQRQFAEYVGVGPKWVVQRCRLLDVAAAANSGQPVDWAGLAADLGYADQAHLVRAWTSFVGQPPAAYAKGV